MIKKLRSGFFDFMDLLGVISFMIIGLFIGIIITPFCYLRWFFYNISWEEAFKIRIILFDSYTYVLIKQLCNNYFKERFKRWFK